MDDALSRGADRDDDNDAARAPTGPAMDSSLQTLLEGKIVSNSSYSLIEDAGQLVAGLGLRRPEVS